MRVLEVCAGIGGMSLASEWMGWEVAGHVEIDPFCTRVLHKHWPDVPHVSDIYDCRGDEFGTIDLLCGGIPCQPWSVAGKQEGFGDARDLWPEFFRLALVLRPTWCVVENVGAFVGLALDQVWTDLEGAGYTVGAAVLPACGVNAPHRRDRVWVVAHAEGAGLTSRGLSGRTESSGEMEFLHIANGSTDAPDAESLGRIGYADAPRGNDADGDDARWQEEAGRSEQRGEDAADADGASRQTWRADGLRVQEQTERLACGSSDVSDATPRGLRRGSAPGRPGQPACGGEAVSHAEIRESGTRVPRLPELSEPRRFRAGGSEDGCARGHEVKSSVGIQNDGPARWVAGRGIDPRYLDDRWNGDPFNAFDDDWEAGVPRVTAGCEQRVNKLKALGNSLVPQVAFQVFRVIAEYSA